MVASEGYWDQDKISLALLHVVGDGVARLRAEPGSRADLGLPYEAVGIAVVQASHDSIDGGGDFGGVWVA